MPTLRAWTFAALIALPTVAVLIAADRAPATMAAAAAAFLQSLSDEQRRLAAFPFDSPERERFHFIPTEMFPRRGLTIKEMTGPQRAAAHALLRTGLSQRGYLTATSIMDLENVLREIEAARPQFVRDPERYFFSVFGTPSDRGAWSWRVEGHHVSLNFTVVSGSLLASSPEFFGTNPAEVRSGPKRGTRILGPLEDPAGALVTSLDAGQRVKGLIEGVAPNDIVTSNKVPITPLAPAGIAMAELSAAQKTLLTQLLTAYTSFAADDIAAGRIDRIRKAGINNVTFAWAGETERGKKHYYRIQGPTFLVEYDNTQDDGNHVHSVWRDFEQDFGRDLLREHIRAAH
jgi:hypothetical protein